MASRLEQATEVGTIMISEDTYTQIKGAFEVSAASPIKVKGKAKPIRVFIVEHAKPRAFRIRTRGIEGVHTPLVGRKKELGVLKDAFRSVVSKKAFRMITVTGDAGPG